MLKLLLHICTAILNTFYRVVANCPYPHFLVIFVEYFQAFLYIAIMVNLVCYIFLKFAYFVSFETINTLLDEKIILMMKIVTCGTAAIALLAQLTWKVRNNHVKCIHDIEAIFIVISSCQVHKNQFLLSVIPIYLFLGGPEITNKRNEGVFGG